MFRYTCPHCQRVVSVSRREELPTRPFCTARCQQIDFGKWLNGEYVISDPLPASDAPVEGADGAEGAGGAGEQK